MLRFLTVLAFSSIAFAQTPQPPGAFARLGGTALRHPEKPLALAFRPGTRELASLGTDGTVRIWDTTTGKELQILRKKDHHANAMSFSENGAFLAVHFGERQLWLYNPAKKYETATFANIPQLESITITDNGKFVAGMRQGEPMLVEVSGDARELTLPAGTAVAVAPDGKSVAVARKDADTHFVDMLEVPSGKRMLRMVRPGKEKAAITSVAYAPDNRTLAMASDSGAPIVIFQLGREEPLAKFEGDGPVAFAGNEWLCGRRNGNMYVWDMKGEWTHNNIGESVSAYSLGMQGKLAATNGGDVFGAPRIRIWDLENERERLFGEEPVSGLQGVVPGEETGVLPTRAEIDVLWDPHKNKVTPLELCARPARDSTYRSAKTTGSTFRVHTYGIAKPLLFININDDKVESTQKVVLPSMALQVAVHPEGKSFAIIGRDGFVRVCNREGKELWTARVARSLRAGIAYSPDGKTIVATSVVKVAFFDSADGKDLGTIGRQWEDGPFTSVGFNYDGSLFAVGTQGANGCGLVYETASRGLVKRCEANSGSVVGVAFSGKTDDLVTAHADDSLLAWHTFTPKKAPPDAAKLWEAMASKDAEVAWPAMMEMVAFKEKAATVIAEGLKKEAKTDEEKLRKQRADVVMKRMGSMK